MTSNNINATEYQQIKQIVSEYLHMSDYAKPTYLSQVAAEFPTLIDTIKSMVGYKDRTSNFILDTLPITLNRSTDIDGALFSKDDQSKFTLQTKLSTGGYSQVYHAIQMRPVKREVAIKFLNRLPKQSLLLAEAEFLARLNHPNIAVLYEFGETTDGRLFIVMELVTGTDLISFAEQHQLSIKAKIALFKQLCLGLAHAHEKGIIHCDIKPSNVMVKMVNGEPTVKIIDFGVSKYQRLDEDEAAVTGTPAYMAPESLTRKDLLIDTRNDVYSMGVLLHRLLSGAMPDFKGQLQIHLNADIQAIISQSMHQNRNQRYSNSMELFDELNRHLNHEVVKARPPNFFYGLSRFFLKFKIQAIIFLAFLLTVSAGYYAQLIQARVAKEAQIESEQVASFVIDLLSTVDPEISGEKQSAEDLILTAKKQLLEVPEPTLSDSRFMYTVGEMLYRLDKQEDALEVANASYQLRLKLTSKSDPSLLNHLTQQAKIHRKLKDFESARNVLLTALEIQQTDDPNPRQLSFIHNQLGNLNFDLKDNDKSLAHHQLALKFRQEINDQKLIADSLNNIGAQYYDKKQWRESGDYFHQSLKLLKQEYGPDHAYTYYVANNLATIEEKQFNWLAAEELFKEATTGLTRIYGEHHFNSLTSHTNLAKMYVRSEQYDQAITLFLDILSRYVINEDNHNQVRMWSLLGDTYSKASQFKLSAEHFDRGISIGESVRPINHASLSMIKMHYGKSLRKQGMYEKAESLLTEAINHEIQHQGGHFHISLRAQNELAQLFSDQGQYQAAIDVYQNVLQAEGVNNSIKINVHIQSYMGLGKVYQYQGDSEQAMQQFQKALELSVELNGKLSKLSGEIISLQGDLFLAFNQPEKAQNQYDQALLVLQKVLPANHSAIAEINEKKIK